MYYKGFEWKKRYLSNSKLKMKNLKLSPDLIFLINY
tara:strand:+ start:33910 stop:34017 length:108 start_codon:yes stop_codon:yes gene_type:complete